MRFQAILRWGAIGSNVGTRVYVILYVNRKLRGRPQAKTGNLQLRGYAADV